MTHLNMHTPDITDSNIQKIGELFPNCLTERLDENGKPEKAIDFDKLRQELSKEIVEGPQERYQFTWPDKRNAMRLANTPTNMTLRPCREESVDFDNTENLYIEGDNLEVLKLLRENYLGKVKMIYIDPPYNTGNDFVYNDDFAQDSDEYKGNSGQTDDLGNRMVQNTESNGRFHTDWLNMMYPRLKVARDLLSDDGVIFISIDDNEVENLKKVCDEVFGESNCVGDIIRKTKTMTADSSCGFNMQHEYLLIFSKNKGEILLHGNEKDFESYSNPDDDPNGDWCAGDPSAKSGGSSTYFEIENPYTKRKDLPPIGRYWAFSKDTLIKYIDSGKIKFKYNYKNGERGFIFKRYKKDASSLYEPVHSLFGIENIFMNQAATVETKVFFKQNVFSYPKPESFIRSLIKYSTLKENLILDFFSGSATTAHAVMQLNAEDGGHRKFIMVQLPEETAEGSEARKQGYANICEIGKERIRRAGKKIKEENPLTTQDLDTGFRVLKLDSSNMEDVYYTPEQSGQTTLYADNVKSDRTSEDLLFQVMLECNLPLSAKIEKQNIAGKEVFNVNDGYLIACFDTAVSETLITAVAKQKPYYFVMRDSSLSSDNVADNFEQIFKAYSKDTVRRIL